MNMMKAAYLLKTGEIGFKDLPIPEPKGDQALIKIGSVGICGSDVHYYKHGRIGSFVVKEPLILGHESAGEVVDIGRNVKRLKIGDRVAIEPGVPCRKCFYCRRGNYNLCSDMVFYGTPPVDGTFREYITHPSDFVYPLPNTMGFDEGAMLEPLSVGIYASQLAAVHPGDSVVVLGAGPIGLVTLQAAKTAGASIAIVSDNFDQRLTYAKKLGANCVLNAKRVNVVEEILALTHGFGADVVFDAAGSEETTRATITLARKGGSVVWIGMASQGEFRIPVSDAIAKGLRISGQFRYANTYSGAIELVSQGRIDVQSLITKLSRFDELPQAFEGCSEGDPESIKTIIRF